jgi:hypothetical protein
LHAVDQIYPLLNDLYESLCKISSLPPDWKGKVDIKKWLTEMNNMSASDELSPEQVRILLRFVCCDNWFSEKLTLSATVFSPVGSSSYV